MSELHWTGAAVLLALAVLGSENARARQTKMLSWADFALEDALAAASRREREDPRRLAASRVRNARPHGAQTRRAS
jgi:hypothetical protein